jgi:2-keto-4-pentenoate hydratase/2-oxohepta-3-ene-1,7-dioic acid hydratase in catechol pathway
MGEEAGGGRARLVRPGKIIGVGLNYRDHASEAGLEIPDQPVIFGIWPTSVIGPGDFITIPSLSSQIDYEAELGVVIGEQARDVPIDRALEVVAGYTCFNDVSARDLQLQDGQWTRAKSLDTFSPVGPRVAPTSEIGDPQALRIRCFINGVALQDSSTADMVFSVADLVAYISRSVTLEPGDLVATGTPAGVGFTREPPVFLRSGDEVTVEIEGVGVLTNPVRAVSEGTGKNSQSPSTPLPA